MSLWVPSGPARLAGLFILVPIAGLFAQALRLGTATAAPGEWTVMEIGWTYSPSHKMLSLQWEVLIPVARLELEGERMLRLSLAGRDAGKSLDCAVGKGGEETRVVRCVVSGGSQPIPDGTLALVSLKVREKAEPGPVRIRLDHVVAVGDNLNGVILDPSEGVLIVRAK